MHLFLQEALSLLSSSVKDKCEVYGDYSENVSDTYKMMASIHLSQGNIPKALKTYKKVFFSYNYPQFAPHLVMID